MLRIKCEVRPSSKAELGLGLFTLQDLKKGDVIWQFDPGLDIAFHIDQLNLLSNTQLEFITKYGWREKDKIYASCDLEKFINHSFNPNVEVNPENVVCATNTIKFGEELFIDYSTFDDDFSLYSSTLV